MGLFSSSEPESTGLPVLSQKRMIDLFDEQKWNYFVDNQGDLGGIWDNNTFYFLLRGHQKEILFVTARWHATLPFEYLEKVRELVNEWNRGALWPKCLHRITDEGEIQVTAEMATDFEHGVTDEQLLLTIRCAIGNTGRFFDAMDEQFPPLNSEGK